MMLSSNYSMFNELINILKKVDPITEAQYIFREDTLQYEIRVSFKILDKSYALMYTWDQEVSMNNSEIVIDIYNYFIDNITNKSNEVLSNEDNF